MVLRGRGAVVDESRRCKDAWESVGEVAEARGTLEKSRRSRQVGSRIVGEAGRFKQTDLVSVHSTPSTQSLRGAPKPPKRTYTKHRLLDQVSLVGQLHVPEHHLWFARDRRVSSCTV